jgi:hypothetical protein
VNKKNNLEQMARVFLPVMVGLKKPVPIGRRVWCVQLEEQAVEGSGLKGRPVVRYISMYGRNDPMLERRR